MSCDFVEALDEGMWTFENANSGCTMFVPKTIAIVKLIGSFFDEF